MNYDEAIAYIHGIYKRGKKDGLKRIAELFELMGNPQDSLRFVHVAGTNGKGSVCVMLSGMLCAAGYRVGLFTSPYIERFNERIQLNGEQIGDEALAEATAHVHFFVEQMETPPSEFELVVAVAAACFHRAGCEIVVWETGLGGLNDATNVVQTKLLEIITAIDYDHTRELGDTLSQIAAHKCGILLPGTPVVTCAQPPEAMAVIEQSCAQKGTCLYLAQESGLQFIDASLDGQRFRYRDVEYTTALLGRHQLQNAAVALHAVELLGECGFPVTQEEAVRGLAQARWPGRFEVLSHDPVIVADGGHNPQGVRAAVEAAKEVLRGKQLTVVVGVMADKALDAMLASLSEIAARFIATAPDYPRALAADKLGELLAPFGKPVEVCDDVGTAVRMAAEYATNDENGAALCVGTLYMIGAVRGAGKAAGLAIRDSRRKALRELSKHFFDNRAQERAEISQRITRRLLQTPEYAAAKTIFAFAGTARELDTCALIEQVLADGKRVCVPLCGEFGSMTAREIHTLDDLVPGAFGILEPSADTAVILPQDIDLGLIPCAVCDRKLRRIGKGGGFYDRYLSGSPMIRMVLCPDGLVQDSVPQESHDQPMDVLITEKGVFRRGE